MRKMIISSFMLQKYNFSKSLENQMERIISLIYSFYPLTKKIGIHTPTPKQHIRVAF